MKENIQVTRSKEWISKALITLIKKDAFRKISVEDIAKEAGVTRPTFYRNFKSKEDVLIEHGRKIYNKLMVELESDIKTKSDTYSLIKKIVMVFDEYAELFKLLLDNNLEYLIMQSFEIEISNILMTILGVEKDDKYKIKFYEGALFSIAVEWIKSSQKESVDELTSIIYNLIYN